VALDDVAAERAAGSGGQFEIKEGAGGKRAKGCLVKGLLGQVGVEESGMDVERGEAHAGDAERIAFAETAGEAGSFDRDAADAAAIGEADEGSSLLDDAGEHFSILREQGTGNREQGAGSRD
jgi:hypothetical protein